MNIKDIVIVLLIIFVVMLSYAVGTLKQDVVIETITETIYINQTIELNDCITEKITEWDKADEEKQQVYKRIMYGK